MFTKILILLVAVCAVKAGTKYIESLHSEIPVVKPNLGDIILVNTYFHPFKVEESWTKDLTRAAYDLFIFVSSMTEEVNNAGDEFTYAYFKELEAKNNFAEIEIQSNKCSTSPNDCSKIVYRATDALDFETPEFRYKSNIVLTKYYNGVATKIDLGREYQNFNPYFFRFKFESPHDIAYHFDGATGDKMRFDENLFETGVKVIMRGNMRERVYHYQSADNTWKFLGAGTEKPKKGFWATVFGK